ncbi:MAG: FxLYD domain-containing protein, partial [Gemmatimonadota bacterium]|nr:FxLYD domain-containing protein [Gemmatimonadota bacterium]
EAVAFRDPSISQVLQTRVQRDTLITAIERDSARLAALVAEWSGRNLRPDTRAAVQRDSTTLADHIAAARAQLAGVQAAHDRDSAAATNVLAGGLKAYEQYLDRYPDDAETMLRLLRRYSIVGYRSRLADLTARIAGMEDLDLGALTQVGTNLFNDGMVPEAAALLNIVTTRNPHAHDALYVLSRVHYAAHDTAELMSVTSSLLAVDPLNPQAVRMMAAAWDLAGNADSVRKYVAQADSGLGWGVTITQFVPAATSAIVNGSVVNLTGRQLAATTLVFDFLDAAGTVLATVAAQIPPLESRRRHALSVRTEVSGATAWRYRQQ